MSEHNNNIHQENKNHTDYVQGYERDARRNCMTPLGQPNMKRGDRPTGKKTPRYRRAGNSPVAMTSQRVFGLDDDDEDVTPSAPHNSPVRTFDGKCCQDLECHCQIIIN